MNPDNFPRAIIFDMDGTIAHTEYEGHFQASNEAIRKLGLDFQWTWEEYKALLPIAGTANRLDNTLKERGLSDLARQKYIEDFRPLKRDLYNGKYLSNVTLRNGIKHFLSQVVERGIQLAIVTSSHESQVEALLRSKLSDYKSHFNPILGKESGVKVGPEGILYEKCLALLEISAEQAMVVEDSQSGMEAAVKAGIPTSVFYNEYTYGSAFAGARLVAPSIHYFSLDQLITLMKKAPGVER